MFDPDNPPELSESDNTSYIKKALLSTLEGHPYIELNQPAINALDILPKLRADGLPDQSASTTSRSNTTLFAVLNKCRTISGQRLLSLWLRNPLISKERIDSRLDIVEHLATNNELRTACHDEYLRKIPDLLRLCCKISKEKCTILDLVKAYNICNSAKGLSATYNNIINSQSIVPPDSVRNLFNWISTSYASLKDFIDLLEDSLMLDNPDENNDYLLKPKSNDDIAKITDELDTLCKRARKELRVVAEDVGLEAEKSLKLEIDADKGFDFRVTRQNEQLIRGNSKYVQSSQVKKDGYRFTTKLLTKLSNSYLDAKAEYKSVAKNVYREIISQAVMYDEQILELCMSFTVLDVLVSLAAVAVQNNYCKPLILEKDANKIDIEKMRHPCVENQPDIENYVPNDIQMNQLDKKQYIVTGPNMGGKSTYIKSVGVAVIMAQCGSMVPASNAVISIVDNIFTRVGAGDKQAEGVSTFMEEMTDMAQILAKASQYSLVIIDELGRGTSTFDGFGLAWSITKHLAAEIKSYTIFATHFHELTELEKEVPTVGNLHVKAYCYEDKLTMLYNVDQGVCDESYGIHVARYVQFPEHVIEDAQRMLKLYEGKHSKW